MYNTSTKKIISDVEVQNELKIRPCEVITWKSLKGCSSDNVKGVPFLKDKEALGLIYKYNDLTTIYGNLLCIPNNVRIKLKKYKEKVFLNQQLVSLKTDFNESELKQISPTLNLSAIKERFEKWEFKKFLEDWDDWEKFHNEIKESSSRIL
jgi:DNA polymerase-1